MKGMACIPHERLRFIFKQTAAQTYIEAALLNLIAKKQASSEDTYPFARIAASCWPKIIRSIRKYAKPCSMCGGGACRGGGQRVDALNIFRRGEIDLILMDCMMPEMDGYTAASEIRLLEEAAGNGRNTDQWHWTAKCHARRPEKCLAAA